MIEGDSAPVMITNGMTQSGVDMMLASGDSMEIDISGVTIEE